jgi:hypothetical protein
VDECIIIAVEAKTRSKSMKVAQSLLLTAACVAWFGFSASSVEGASSPKSTRPATPKSAPKVDVPCYYVVIHADGTQAIQEMTQQAAAALLKQLENEQKVASDKQLAANRRYIDAGGKAEDPPVPIPVEPRLQKMSRVPTDQKQKDRILGELNREYIDMWDVCLVQDMQGKKHVEVFRHDATFGKNVTMATEFVDAYVADQNKRSGAGADKTGLGPEPVRPVVKILAGSLPTRADADRLCTFHQKELDEAGKKPANTDQPPDDKEPGDTTRPAGGK